MASFLAKFDGQALIPVGRVDLPVDKLLEVEVHDPTAPAEDRMARLRAYLARPRRVTPEDVAELERAIEEGKMPVRYDDDPFGADPKG